MPFHEFERIRYFTFESLDDAGVAHGMLTRRGGVSPAPWAALNLGGTVGDDAGRVRENRRLSFEALGRPLDSSFDVWQVHSASVVVTDRPRPPETPHLQADAILTGTPGITLFMRFADCVPVLLYDPQHKAAGLVHAGWQGTVKQVVKAAVEAMQASFGTRPQDLLAAIGPSIAAHHYPVGADVVARVQAAFGGDAASLLSEPAAPAENGQIGVQFDLWAANRLILEQSGVRRIETAGLCTVCHVEDWFSHRGENGKTGRFGALIGL